MGNAASVNRLRNVILAAPNWSLNGPNVFSANLARELNARGIAAHIVLTRPDWLDAKPLPKPADIVIQTLPVSPFMSFRNRCAAMIRYLEEHSPCIYIPNHDFGHSCVSPQLSDRIITIGIIHSDDPQHYEHTVRMGGYWNRAVAVSSAIAQETLKLAPALAGRISVIPHGVAAAAVFPERQCKLDEPLRAIYAGRLDQPQKRVLDLPKILYAAARESVRIHLTIAGRGAAEKQLKADLATLGRGHTVEFLGTVENGTLAQIFARQDVFLLTSEFEGLPISLLEAMGHGCVPIVTDIRSGAPDLICNCLDGFRVPIGDVDGFAARLAALYKDPVMRRQMAYAAYVKASSGCYRMKKMAESYIRLFTEAIDEQQSGAFRRPVGKIRAPLDLRWTERFPAPLQYWGHRAKQVLTERAQ
jgi:glycosyltransferase involved in cell wall biosynthesis